MYIDPFWCGVIATVLIEIAIVIALVALYPKSRK